MQLVWGGRNPALRVPTTDRGLGGAGPGRARGAQGRRGAAIGLPRPAHRRTPAADGGGPADPQPAGRPAGIERFARFMGYDTALAFATALLTEMDTVRQQDAACSTARTEERRPRSRLTRCGPWGSPSQSGSGGDRGPGGRVSRAPSAPNGRGACWRPCCPACCAPWPTSASRTLPSCGSTRCWAACRRACTALPAAAPAGAGGAHRLRAGGGPLPGRSPGPGAGGAGGLAEPGSRDRRPGALLHAQLTDARALDDAVAIVRRTVRGEEFRLSVAQMEGRLDADDGRAAAHRPGRCRPDGAAAPGARGA